MRRAALLVLLAVILVTRTAFPALDPPYLSFSRGEYTDPGFYLNNARSLVLTGEPLVGDWDNRLLFPVMHALVWSAWSLAGYGPATTAGLLALLAAGTGLLLHGTLTRHAAPAAGLLALAWFALAAPLLLPGRVPLLENALLPLLTAILAVRALPAGPQRHGTLLLLVLLAVGVKYSALFVLPALALVSVSEWRRDCGALRGEERWFWLPLTALLLATALGMAALRPPALLATFADKMTRYAEPHFGWHELFLPVETNFFWRMPLLTLSAFLMAGLMLWQQGRATRLLLTATALLVAWYCSIVFIRYNPLRYQLVTAPFLIALAAQFWTLRGGATPAPVTLFRLLAWFVLTTTVAYGACYTTARSLLGLAVPRPTLVLGATLVGALALALVPQLRRWRWQPSPRLLLPLLLTVVIISGLQVRQEWQRRDYRLAVIGHDLAHLVPAEATVAGWYAPAACLHNTRRVYTTYRLTPDKIATHRIGYLLLETAGPGTEPLGLQGELSPLRGRLRHLHDWAIPRTRIHLGLFAVQP